MADFTLTSVRSSLLNVSETLREDSTSGPRQSLEGAWYGERATLYGVFEGESPSGSRVQPPKLKVFQLLDVQGT